MGVLSDFNTHIHIHGYRESWFKRAVVGDFFIVIFTDGYGKKTKYYIKTYKLLTNSHYYCFKEIIPEIPNIKFIDDVDNRSIRFSEKDAFEIFKKLRNELKKLNANDY